MSIAATEKYPPVAVALHWLSALVIIWALVSGLYVAFFCRHADIAHGISSFNASLTALMTPIFLCRAIYRLGYRAPPLKDLSLINIIVARTTQGLTYVFALISFSSGWLMMRQPITIFQIIEIPHPLHDPQWLHFFRAVHSYSNVVLCGLVFLHVAGVVKHQIAGQRMVQRMSL
jgi:superoxide oxidase